MKRCYGRAPSHERAYGRAPANRGAAVTLVLGLGLQGIVAPCAFEGSMNGHVFGLYMSEQVVPLLPPDGIAVVDNLPAHHAEDASDALEARGVVVVDDVEEADTTAPGLQVWFLPSYSPELSPAEECGSKVKTLTRSAEPRTMQELIDAMGHAIGQVTPHDARAWFDHAHQDRAPRPHPEVTDPSGESGAPSSEQPRAGPNG